jgi:hypothetical protein
MTNCALTRVLAYTPSHLQDGHVGRRANCVLTRTLCCVSKLPLAGCGCAPARAAAPAPVWLASAAHVPRRPHDLPHRVPQDVDCAQGRQQQRPAAARAVHAALPGLEAVQPAAAAVHDHVSGHSEF